MKKLFLACLTMCAMFVFVSQDTQAQDIHEKTAQTKTHIVKNPVLSVKKSMNNTKADLQRAKVQTNTVNRKAVKGTTKSLHGIPQPALSTKKAALIKK